MERNFFLNLANIGQDLAHAGKVNFALCSRLQSPRTATN